MSHVEVGERIKIVEGNHHIKRPYDGLTGTLIRRTRAYNGCVVWLDRAYRYSYTDRHGRRSAEDTFVLYLNENKIEATDDGPRFTPRLAQMLHRGKAAFKVLLKTLEVIDRETGEVVAEVQGARAGVQRAERLAFIARMEARNSTKQEVR